MRNGRAKTTKIIGGILALFGVAGLVCAGTLSTAALEESISKDVTVGIDPVISISVPESVTLNITPSTSPELKTVSTVVTVGTNNITGYTLYMSIDNTSTNALVNQAQTSLTIPTLTGVTPIVNFPVNQWGYSKDNPIDLATFLPLPAVGSEDKFNITAAPAAASNTNVTFGTKIDMSVASGTYSNVAKFTAVTNEIPEPPTPPATCDTYAPGITYMQDIDDTVKGNMIVDQQYFAVDKRDDKGYCIAKLQDGNIWMTQNLDLNLDNGTPLNSETSDISSDRSPWTPQTTLSQSDISSWTGSDYDVVRSIDMGDFYYDGSTNSSQSGTTYEGMTGFLTPSDPNINQHYHVGNLYSWNAATANSRASSAGTGEATDSICPKGWRLPKGGPMSNEFSNMLSLYGAWTSGSSGTVQNLIDEPVYMVRGGSVYSGQLWFAANHGNYWSSTANSSNNGYELNFNITSYVRPANTTNRYRGLSLRCIARSAEEPVNPVNPDNPGGGGGAENNVNNVYNNVYNSNSSSDGSNTDAADGYTAPQGVFNSTTENQPNWFLIICLSIMSLLLLALIIYLIYRLRKEAHKDQQANA